MEYYLEFCPNTLIQYNSYNFVYSFLISELCDIRYVVNSEGMNESAVLDTAQYVHECVKFLHRSHDRHKERQNFYTVTMQNDSADSANQICMLCEKSHNATFVYH